MQLRIFTEPQQGASYDQLLAVAGAADVNGFDAFFRSDHLMRMGDDDPAAPPAADRGRRRSPAHPAAGGPLRRRVQPAVRVGGGDRAAVRAMSGPPARPQAATPPGSA
jgi:hypothetical protein